MSAALVILMALVMDRLLGEPRRGHPLVGFGRLAQVVEAHLYGPAIEAEWLRRLRGLIGVAVLITPFVLLVTATRGLPYGFVLDALILYLAVGWKSLSEHALRVRDALGLADLVEARRCVGLMVSRDTAAMRPEDVARATVESVLENGNDAVFGALFWFVVAGAPGVVVYRLANTLDAMWGYRNDRYRHFGWAAARLDDVLNLIPARLTALSYALSGRVGQGLRCWRQQGSRWKSPNAGPVMAAGAGSLGLALGGPASYHGALQVRPVLGAGRAAEAVDIDAALGLLTRSLGLWLAVLLGGTWLVDRLH